MLIGSHISVAGGYEDALEYALSVGCECAQVFAKSPRQWKGPGLDAAAAERFEAQRRAQAFGPVFTHAAYLLNLATADDVLWERSVDALADELARGALLGASGVVTHVGSDRLREPARAAERVARAVSLAFERVRVASGPGARLLLENTAGAGDSFGSTFEQLGDVVSRAGLPASRLGVCLDTCHAHAFGLAMDSRAGWERALASIAGTMGLDRLGLVHANDCMFEAGSRRDRHAWIGDGTIGEGGFAAMFEVVSDAADLAGLCAVTEMSGEKPRKDAENLRRLAALRAGAGQGSSA